MDGYKRLGGFMLFFVILQALGIISLFRSLSDLQGGGLYYNSTIGTVIAMLWLSTIIQIIGSIICIVLIIQKNKVGIKAFYISRIIAIILSVLSILMLSRNEGISILSVILNIVSLLVWKQYFDTSQRVSVYFAK
ncbi:MAG: hypothetical protein ACK5LC_07480 [Coprobacillaceae bacterium]